MNLAISALTFAVAISLVQPAAHWALQQHAEIQRVQKAGLADPSLLLYQLGLHDPNEINPSFSQKRKASLKDGCAMLVC